MVEALNCDVCGEPILGPPMKVIIEGAKVVVCHRCAKLGKPYVEPAPRRIPERPPAPRRTPRPTRTVTRQEFDEFEVTEDYSTKIREAREKMGLTQQDLAIRVKEKLSIIQKIESGKMVPDMKLCRELEHFLRIGLLTPKVEVPPLTDTAGAPSPTLGDIVRLKQKVKGQ
jgi:putative transcription factor